MSFKMFQTWNTFIWRGTLLQHFHFCDTSPSVVWTSSNHFIFSKYFFRDAAWNCKMMFRFFFPLACSNYDESEFILCSVDHHSNLYSLYLIGSKKVIYLTGMEFWEASIYEHWQSILMGLLASHVVTCISNLIFICHAYKKKLIVVKMYSLGLYLFSTLIGCSIKLDSALFSPDYLCICKA